MGRRQQFRHVLAKTSWWSGRATALCGATFESGGYEVRWFSNPTCPACRRQDKEGKR